jgi:hypothetical protein
MKNPRFGSNKLPGIGGGRSVNISDELNGRHVGCDEINNNKIEYGD